MHNQSKHKAKCISTQVQKLCHLVTSFSDSHAMEIPTDDLHPLEIIFAHKKLACQRKCRWLFSQLTKVYYIRVHQALPHFICSQLICCDLS